ncbi:MAG: hypothetical protein GYB31_18590 [Bacteroidetes bacterium]|nr:hypothetical protein [Bacteroidota bacterium]
MKSFELKSAKTMFMALALILSVGLFSSCKTEGCTDPMSDNYDPEAQKDDGSCIPWSDKFIGTYAAERSCTGEVPQNGNLVVTRSSTGEQVLLFTFDDLNFTGEVVTTSSVIINNQTINYQGQEVNVSGTGSLDDDKGEITLDFTVSAGVINSVCDITGTRL